MFNRDGVKNTKYGAPVQILMNVELQLSVGCRVPQSLGTDVAGIGKIAKAGTPIHVDMGDLQTEVSTSEPNAVLLHNVDVTDGTKNGTALIFGFVNINRLESDVQAKVTAGTKIGDVQFLKV